jgi:hypothetical protein
MRKQLIEAFWTLLYALAWVLFIVLVMSGCASEPTVRSVAVPAEPAATSIPDMTTERWNVSVLPDAPDCLRLCDRWWHCWRICVDSWPSVWAEGWEPTQ